MVISIPNKLLCPYYLVTNITLVKRALNFLYTLTAEKIYAVRNSMGFTLSK